MAIVTKQSDGARIEGADVEPLLSSIGILYERWEVEKLAHATRPAHRSVQDHVLDTFADEIEDLKTRRGYQSADVIALEPTTPNLGELLAKFDKEHFHTEDEVRFVVSGRGVFSIRADDGEFYDVEVRAGDLIAVPEGTKHYFTLCDDKQIQCIRLFTEKAGWVANYV